MKNNLSFREFYRRNLPHIQIAGSTYFITFRLANSLPLEALNRLAEDTHRIRKLPDSQKPSAYFEWFIMYDDYLDQVKSGEQYLMNEKIADVVAESIQYRDGKVYDLIAYCVMPNHVHLICTPLANEGTFYSLTEILHSLKRHTAREANKILNRSGAFWQDESYDHFVRDEAELDRIIKYVLHNPVKAGLTDEESKWKWTYCKFS